MKKSIVAIMSEVVTFCSTKWMDPNKCSMCECDSNWITNMYLDYTNNYITWSTFAIEEILTPMEIEREEDFGVEYAEYKCAVYSLMELFRSLMELFRSIGNCQPAISHERVGEICIKILKGEI